MVKIEMWGCKQKRWSADIQTTCNNGIVAYEISYGLWHTINYALVLRDVKIIMGWISYYGQNNHLRSALVCIKKCYNWYKQLAAILDLKPLGDQETIFVYFFHVLRPQNIYLGTKFVHLWWLEVEVWNIPFLAFRCFFSLWCPFWKCPKRGGAS